MTKDPHGPEQPDDPDLTETTCRDCGAPVVTVTDDNRPLCPTCHQFWCDEIVLGGIAVMQDRARAKRQNAA